MRNELQFYDASNMQPKYKICLYLQGVYLILKCLKVNWNWWRKYKERFLVVNFLKMLNSVQFNRTLFVLCPELELSKHFKHSLFNQNDAEITAHRKIPKNNK